MLRARSKLSWPNPDLRHSCSFILPRPTVKSFHKRESVNSFVVRGRRTSRQVDRSCSERAFFKPDRWQRVSPIEMSCSRQCVEKGRGTHEYEVFFQGLEAWRGGHAHRAPRHLTASGACTLVWCVLQIQKNMCLRLHDGGP